MWRATSVEPVKATPGDRRMRRQAAPTAPSPGTRCSAVAGMPARVEQPHRLGGDQRCLLGGFGDDAVAGDQRRRDLAGEDGERKIPGLMQTNMPRPRITAVRCFLRSVLASSRCTSAARLGARNSDRNRPPRALRRPHRQSSCRPRPAAADERPAAHLEQIAARASAAVARERRCFSRQNPRSGGICRPHSPIAFVTRPTTVPSISERN